MAKTITQLVIDALMTGKALKSNDIAEMITEKKVSVKDISSLLSKLSNKDRCALGCFIERKQVNGIFVYSIVKEALSLSEDQAYGLSLKTGYSLDQAVEDFPKLKKYVGAVKKKAEPKKAKPVKKAAKPAKKPVIKKPDAVAPVKELTPASVSASADDAEELIAGVIQKIADGDLNINLKLSVKLEK